jgi:hypothetical protein
MLCLNETKKDERKQETEEVEDQPKKMEIDSSPPKPSENDDTKLEKIIPDEKKIKGIGDKYSEDLIK